MQTVFGIAAGVLFLGEPATAPLVGGAVVCMAGVTLTQIQPHARSVRKAHFYHRTEGKSDAKLRCR